MNRDVPAFSATTRLVIAAGLGDQRGGPPRAAACGHHRSGGDHDGLSRRARSVRSSALWTGSAALWPDGTRHAPPSTRHPAFRVCILATARLAFDGSTAGLERPKVLLDRTRALTREQIAVVWRHDDIAAARTRLLAAAVRDCSPRQRDPVARYRGPRSAQQARTRSKQRRRNRVGVLANRCRALAAALAGRPVMRPGLPGGSPAHAGGAERRPVSTHRPCAVDYRRAAELFSHATNGWTLHQLRHSALTHAAEDGTNTPILLARSRHASVRSLERYARPGPEAVARHVAEHDPARRRR